MSRALEHTRKLLHYSFDIMIVSPFAAIGADVVGMHFLFDALSGDTPLDREGAGISLRGSGRGLMVHSASMVRRREIEAFFRLLHCLRKIISRLPVASGTSRRAISF